MRSRRTTIRIAALVLGPLALLASCSSGSGSGTATPTPGSGAPTGTGDAAPSDLGGPTTTVVRPPGPAADVSEELTGGNGVFLAAASAGVDLAAAGYTEHEYVAAGTATSYTSAGELPGDGRFALTPGVTADYRTRIVVRRPADPANFSGTAIVEWLNVSGGLDANPDWSFTADEIVRQGHAWIGVSAQAIGVEGGPVAVSLPIGQDLAGKGLKALDPARYGTLSHPGDAFAYDMYTQVARALRADDASGLLGGAEPQRVLAVGESQSAFALTTYVNGVQPLTEQFDGFLIHSRGGASLPLGTPGEAVSIANAIGGGPIRIRTDQDVPVLILETESDLVSVIGYEPARQPDTEHIHLWEVAGTAHADRSLLGPIADSLDCGVAVNDGPQRFAVRAALRALDAWVVTGEAPPEAPRLQIDKTPEGVATIARDADGIAVGGIRLPPVAVPTETLSGEPGPTGGVICLLLGSTVPFTPAQLSARYPSRPAYQEAYREATNASIAGGWALPEDDQALAAEANPDLVPG